MAGPLLRLAAPLTAFVIMLTSCTSEDSAGAPKATDVPSSPSASQFVSERHSYHLEVPAGWKVAEYGGTWTDFAQFSPGAEVPGEDVVSAPDGSGFLVSNSMAIPDGMSPDEWLAELERLVTSGPDQELPGNNRHRRRRRRTGKDHAASMRGHGLRREKLDPRRSWLLLHDGLPERRHDYQSHVGGRRRLHRVRRSARRFPSK